MSTAKLTSPQPRTVPTDCYSLALPFRVPDVCRKKLDGIVVAICDALRLMESLIPVEDFEDDNEKELKTARDHCVETFQTLLNMAGNVWLNEIEGQMQTVDLIKRKAVRP